VARWPRLIAPGLPIHLTQRGHNRDRTFLDEHDFACYRELLIHTSRRHGCEIHAYALMSNHIHLLLTPSEAGSVAGLMRSMGSRFVRYWNTRHRRSGTLWNGRFNSAIVSTDRYFLLCSRYIDMNPVKAGLVRDPWDYEWSSCRALAHGASDDVLTPHAVYGALGTTAAQRQSAYAAFCAQHLPERGISDIREATRTGTAVGSSHFLDRLETCLQQPTRRQAHGGARRHQGDLNQIAARRAAQSNARLSRQD
jgi:putative transposase